MTGPGCHQSELPNHGLKFFNGCTIPEVVPEVPAHPGSRQCKVRSPFARVFTVCVTGKSAQVLAFDTKKKNLDQVGPCHLQFQSRSVVGYNGWNRATTGRLTRESHGASLVLFIFFVLPPFSFTEFSLRARLRSYDTLLPKASVCLF